MVTVVCCDGHVTRCRLSWLRMLREEPPGPAILGRICHTCPRHMDYEEYRAAAQRQGLILETPLTQWGGRAAVADYRCATVPEHRYQISPLQCAQWQDGCPQSRQERARTQLLAQCATIAEQHGGVVDPDQTYASSMTPLRCTSRVGYGERLALFVMEHLFDKPFRKARPPFLINPATGKRMEFDGYCAEACIAIEHQGKQHDHEVPYFHPTPRAFQAAQQRDAAKRQLARAHGSP